MTGATISSRAVTRGVKEAVEKAAQLGVTNHEFMENIQ